MPKLTLPMKNKTWSPNYYGEFWGDLTQSFNTDLSTRPGFIQVSPTLIQHTTGFVPFSFVYANVGVASGYWTSADKVYRTSNINTTQFTADSLPNSPTTGFNSSDMIVFGKNSSGNDILVVARGTDISVYDSGWNNTWWTTTLSQSALTYVTHPLDIFGNLLLIGDGNKLHTVLKNFDYTYTVRNSRLVFSSSYQINWIKSTKDRVYIGLINTQGGTIFSSFPSLFIEYDPYTEQVREAVVEEGYTVGFKVGNAINIVDYVGNIKTWTGSTFSTLNSFPTVFVDGGYVKIHRNGIVVVGNKILFLVSTEPFVYFPFTNRNMLGGLWSYDLRTNYLVHESSFKTSSNLSFGTTKSYSDSFQALAYFPDAGSIICGAVVYSTDSTSVPGVFTNKFLGRSYSNADRGWFITPVFTSSEINNVWRNILIKYAWTRNFGSSAGSIIVKYKKVFNQLVALTPYWGTWASSNSFTISTSSFSGYGVEVGDEIFIIYGNGDGLSAHITAINSAGGTDTVTIDETLASSPSGGFSFVVDKWRKLSPTISDTKDGWALLDIPDVESDRIQFKIEIRGGLSVEEISVGYQVNMRQEPDQLKI